ncbi:free fatty acid receptor 4-like [Actinia tenebrosa]|uniref:Free fatty acid receptor 4-like n=1 Tax=Actinia tenebrosa TaxID=6105 RepID=A0A6P8HM47_ACTTE|nr:free fatty acid receptor 4-like [Actinia tenebrosa]
MSQNTTETSSNNSLDTADIICLIVFFTQAFIVVLANLLTIITFTINRHLRKRSMYCVINLAVADMLVGLGSLAVNFVIARIYGFKVLAKENAAQSDSPAVKIQFHVYTMTCNATMLSIALVALERMSAIMWPLRHRQCSLRVYALSIAFTWLASILIAIKGVFSFDDSSKEYLGGIWIISVFSVTCASYIAIFCKTRSSQQRSQLHTSPQWSSQDYRLVKTSFLVTVTSFATWIPLALLFIINDANQVTISPYIILFFVVLFVASSFINPIIYVFRLRHFRVALFTLILHCSPDQPAKRIRPVGPAPAT